MKIGIGNWARPFASAWRVVVFTLVVCAAGSAWAEVLTYGSTGSSGDGYYLSNNSASPTTVFTDLSLRDMITKYKMSGYVGGSSITEQEVDGVYNAVLGTDTLTVQFQKADGKYVKGTVVRFIQSGTDIKAYAVNCAYKEYSDASTASASLGVNLEVNKTYAGTAPTSDSEWGYGIYGITLTSLAAGDSPISISSVTTAKPLAVWNGDFVADDSRNGYTLNLRGNSIDSSKKFITILSNSSGGATFANMSSTRNLPVAAVAGISNAVRGGSYTRMLGTICTSANADRAWFGVPTDSDTIKMWCGGASYPWAGDSEGTWPTGGGLHYLGISYDNSSASGHSHGGRSYVDGVLQSYKAETISSSYDPSSKAYGATIGGVTTQKTFNFTGAKIHYVAIVPSSLQSDIQAWSLTEMTAAANFTDGGAISDATNYSATGINLNGGTVTLSGDVTAAAIFVQADTTLSFASGATLTVGGNEMGPIYIADGATLTIDATSCSPAGNAAEDLVKGVFYGKSQVSVKTPSSFGASLSDIGIQIGKYLKWGYAKEVFTWTTPSNGASDMGGASTYTLFDCALGSDTATTYNGNVNGYITDLFWKVFAYQNTANTQYYESPGMALRISGNTFQKNIGGTFSPLVLGGLIVESDATGYSLAQTDQDYRSTILGDVTGNKETWFTFNNSFTFNRGKSTKLECALAGTINFVVNGSDTVVTFTGGSSAPAIYSAVARNTGGSYIGSCTAGGTLKMHGEGKMTVTSLNASNATLDYSDLAPNRGAAFIDGALVINSSTQFKFPANVVFPYPVASSVSGTTANYTIGGVTGAKKLVFSSTGKVTEEENLEISANTDWTTLVAGITKKAYNISVTESAVLTIDGAESDIVSLKFDVAEGKTLTLADSNTLTADSIIITGSGKVLATNATALSGTIKGDGRIVYKGVLPSSSLQTSFQNSTTWTGTVELKNYTETTDAHKIIVLSKYGNINSTVALNGVTSTMYAVKDSYPAVTLKEIEIGEGGWTDTDNEYSATMLYTAKLTGHGPITVKTSGSGTVKFIGDHTFDGSVIMDDNTGKQVAFMKTADDTLPLSFTAKAIVVAGRLNMSIDSSKTWTAPGGVKIDGSLTVLTAEKATATSVVPTASLDGASLTTTVDDKAGTTTYVADDDVIQISDNQATLGAFTVSEPLRMTGLGGALMSSLTINDGMTLTYDPVITPLRVESAPVFNSTGKLKLAARYKDVTCGKFHLVTYPASASVANVGTDLVDSTSFNNNTYTVTEETVGSYKQLVLKVGDYDTNAKPVSIAQFGDSITEGIIRDGYRGTPNYRIPLMQLLEAYGYKPEARGYRKVGSTDANGVPADSAYEYHTGISAQRIYTGLTDGSFRAGFMESIEAHLEQVGVTDIITLKIGTNDSIGGETADNMFEGWSNLVWKIVRMRPTSKIVVCAPVKIRKGNDYNAPGLRTKIAEYVAKTAAQGGFPDGQVTMINGFDVVTDDANYYLTDNVHPNWNGHLQLANAWLPAVTNAFESMKVDDVIVHAKDTYTAQPPVASAETVAELASYRAGYVKLATFTNFNTKLSAWGATPYESVNDTYKTVPMGRVAYFVARKTTASPDTRYVWVDMDADETTGTTLASFGVPTSASVNGVVNNLHIYSNSSAIENVAPTVSGVKGTLMLTEKDVSGAAGIADPNAPAGVIWDKSKAVFDWNDSIDAEKTWGVMSVARKFDGVEPTNHRKLLAAQMLFDFNGFNGTRQNALGIGNFAVHGPYNYANGSVDNFNLNWTFTTAKDEMPTMDVTSLASGVIEIWGKQVYTATIDSDANFSDVATSAGLPVDASACDLVINVTANSTLTFDLAKSVGSITFNIAENKTLTLASESNLTVGKVTVNGPGKLQLSSSGTFGWMDVLSNATLGFANGATLNISGNLFVASGATLTLEPDAISAASSTILSAASISGTVSLTLPTEAGVEYSTLNTDTSYKIVRTPNVAFSYDGTIGATPTGWGIDVGDGGNWKWEGLSKQLRIGPNNDMSLVYETCSGNHSSSPCKKSSSFTLSLYADVSHVVSSGKAVLLCLGSKATSMVVMYRQGDYVRVGNWSSGGFTPAANPWAAAVPIAEGFHLYTATFDFSTGKIALYRDDGSGSGCTSEGTPQENIVLPTGDESSGLQLGCAWDNSGNDFVNGDNMAVAAVRGYDAVLAADNVAKLAESFPAVTSLQISTSITINKDNTTQFTAYDATLTAGYTLQQHRGKLLIPANNTLSVPILRTLNINTGSPTFEATIDGTLEITGASGYNVWSARQGSTPGGIVFGEWSGTGTYTISSTGSICAPNAYLQTIKSAGTQTINVNGGTIDVKGIWADKAGSSITLSDGGLIEVDEIRDDGGSITRNFGHGTFRVKSTATETRAINFTGTSSEPTTLDPCGNTLTMSDGSLSGSGYVTVASSAESVTKGSVVFGANASFGGKVILTDANRDLMNISAYKGAVLYSGTEAETLAKLNGFAGTVYFTGNIDATGINLSAATVNIAAGNTFTADAGKEGRLVVGSGSTVTLNVDDDIVNYDGHFPHITGSCTLSYYNTERHANITNTEGDTYIVGNNLLPYYYVWELPEGTYSGNISDKDKWRLNQNKEEVEKVLPASGKNVAFHVTGHTTISIDADLSYNDIQVYGSGSLTFSGDHTLSAAILNVDVPVAISGSAVQVSDEIRNSADIYFGGTQTCNAVISGRGGVKVGTGSAADVTFNNSNTFTGGLEINSPATAKTTAAALVDGVGTGFGPYGGNITVTTGGQLDLGNTSGVCYNITVNNGGDAITPVIVNTGDAMKGDARQTSSLTVNANATIQCNSGHGWGLVANGRGPTVLTLKKGVTLTKIGDGSFFLCSTEIANSGDGETPKIIIAGGALETVAAGGVNTVAEGASIDITINEGASLLANKSIAASTLTVDGTVNMGGNTLSATTVCGTGRVEYANKLPDASSWATGTASTGWRGTVAFSKQANLTGPNLNSCGNAYSTVALTGVSGSNTYLPDDDITTNVRIEGSVTINNGNPIDQSDFNWTKPRVVVMPSLDVNGVLTFRKVGNTAWNPTAYCYYYTSVLKYGSGGSIDVGNQFCLRVDAVDFASALSGNACQVPLTLTRGGDNKADGILYGPNGVAGEVLPVTVGGVANGQKLVHATVNDTTGLYLAVASVTVNETTTYYPTLAAVKAAVGNSSVTINLLENTSENVALAYGQVLNKGATTYTGTVSAADSSAKIVEDGTTYKVVYGTIFSVW